MNHSSVFVRKVDPHYPRVFSLAQQARYDLKLP